MEHLLVIDVGTSSLKAMLYTSTGKLLNRSSQQYNSSFSSDNHVEQNPQTWQSALLFTLSQTGEFIKSAGLSLDAIVVTSQRASVIPLDKQGNVLHNAIMWQDRRSIVQCERLLAQLELKEIYRRTGLRANPYFSAPKMMWLKDETPDVYHKAAKLVGVQDYVVALLTGRYVTDWSQACRTMLLNINNFTWDDNMLAISGIAADKLPELCPPGAQAGQLQTDMAAVVGLPAGTPVIIGGGDQQCAALALNILRPGYAEANTGTGSFVIAYSETPRFDVDCRTLCSAAAMPGKWIIEAGIFNTGSIHRWFKEQFYPDGQSGYELMNLEAAQSPVGANGVMMLSHFEGSAAPYWNPLAKGTFFNLSLGTERRHVTRAILEGIALEIAHNISLIEVLEPGLSVISVAGGLVAFDLFNQMQADCFDKRVIRYDNNEASSLGALMSAVVSLGIYADYDAAFQAICPEQPVIFEPDRDNVAKYRTLFRRKQALYQALYHGNVYEEFGRSV